MLKFTAVFNEIQRIKMKVLRTSWTFLRGLLVFSYLVSCCGFSVPYDIICVIFLDSCDQLVIKSVMKLCLTNQNVQSLQMKELMATVKNIQKQLAFVLLVLLQSQENSKVASQHSLLIKQSKYRWNWHPSNMHVFYFLCTSFLDRLRIEQCIPGALCLTNVIFK